MTVTEALVNRALFGGALEIACPQRFQDISDFWPVPDHQEVFADGATDQSLLVEIVVSIDWEAETLSARPVSVFGASFSDVEILSILPSRTINRC